MVRTKTSVVDHIDYALVAKTHSSMYMMHKYWARKPHNVVSEYIQHYSNKGDIILDPFAGSGVTAIEAIKLDRKAIAIDLDPMATFITRETAKPVDLKKIDEVFRKIENKIKPLAEDLYETKCPKCKSRSVLIGLAYNVSQPFEMVYHCPQCGRQRAKITDFDIKKLKQIEGMQIGSWYPKKKLAYDGNDFKEGTHDPSVSSVDKLFTKRNLIILSKLLHLIEDVEDIKIRETLKFVFTSTLPQATIMMPYVKESIGKICKGWTVHRYWIPPQHWELNVLIYFKLRFDEILRGKKEVNQSIQNYNEAEKFLNINDGANILIKTYNTIELTKIIPPNSVDYVFTDPPYGGAVQYFELSTLWASWLKMELDYQDEITVNKQQDKDFDYYHKMLAAAFKQIYQILKPGKYMTVTFHSTEIKVWTSIIKAVVLAGFDLEKIIYQPPAVASAKGKLQPYGSAVGDYYIRFRKPESERQMNLDQIDEHRYKRIIVESAKKIIAERGEPTPYAFILNGIIVELKQEGALLSGKQNPDDVMKSFLNKEFVLVDIKNEAGKSIGKKWWLKNPASVPYLEFIPLADRVETAIVEVLRRKVKVSFDDVLQEIFIKFPNALTPETQNIREILQEYASPAKGGNWILKQQVKERESEHSEIIYYLALIGRKAGFDVWIGQKEQGESYGKERLSSFVTKKNPVWRFIPTMNLDRVKQIDVIWHDEGHVKFEFEVENTTAITEAIVRGSNIPHDDIRRLIVIPEEREGLLYRKMQEPLLNENIIKNNWKFLFYKDIKTIFEKNKKKKKIDLNELEKLFKLPKEARQVQNSLSMYL